MADLAVALEKYGIDYADAMERVGDSAEFYKKIAMKYLNDTNYDKLVSAMDVKDFDAGYKAAHSLKGVSGNLSMPALYKASAAVSDALFDGEYQAAEHMMPEVKAAHEKVIEGLQAWQDGVLE